MPTHTVKAGDCISSIAEKHGLFWETVWDHPDNAQLKAEREDPNVLRPGDQVFVPEKEKKEKSCAAGTKHSFVRKGVPARFAISLYDDDEPRAGVPYVLTIDGKSFEGETDSEGSLEHDIPPDAKTGTLVVDGDEEYELSLGKLDPVEEETGVKARLENLGFLADAETQDQEELTAAIEAFQAEHELEATGKADDPTLQKLLEEHGC
jgi:hypothetical protein